MKALAVWNQVRRSSVVESLTGMWRYLKCCGKWQGQEVDTLTIAVSPRCWRSARLDAC